jgi:DNA-binding CsgD family transcriptional regulator
MNRLASRGRRWRDEARDLITGLGTAIDRQLETWGLSPAEKELALLLLKGLSHKEVAGVRGVSEATVRQQARSAMTVARTMRSSRADGGSRCPPCWRECSRPTVSCDPCSPRDPHELGHHRSRIDSYPQNRALRRW